MTYVKDDATLKEQVRSAWTAAWDSGETGALDHILAPGFSRVTAATGRVMSIDDLKQDIDATRRGFPDLVTTIDCMMIEGDKLAIFWHSVGTHSAEMFGVPPTHRQVKTFGTNLCFLSGDKITSEEITWDPRHLLAVLGISSLGEE